MTRERVGTGVSKIAVVAIGGNSLIRDKHHLKVEDQYRQITKTVVHIVEVIKAGYEVVITHGNGPQVGFIMRRSEIAYEHEGLHHVPLASCVANTQGAIGYQIQQALGNELRRKGITKQTATVVTQVKVDPADPGFAHPGKPIGQFYDQAKADELRKDHPDWVMISDAGRGLRRVVASPRPLQIIEFETIADLLHRGVCVIAAGGGGIPVIEDDRGFLQGVSAVIDKDYASALLASQLGAELLLISTGVDNLCLNFGTPKETPLASISLTEAKQYVKEGHFAPGSMLPKIEAIIQFLEHGGKKAIVTKPDNIGRAMAGSCGTSIVAEKSDENGG